MIIYPAIDLRAGRCVRLVEGDFHQETVFSTEPEIVAEKWQKLGAKFLHVVDLDGALAGASKNQPALLKILAKVSIPVQLGGGIRNLQNIEDALRLGVNRVILGSVAARDPELVKQALATYGERIVIGIDAKNGKVAVDGWSLTGDMDAYELSKRMADLGARRIIFTDISRDGKLSGVNIEATLKMALESGLGIIASGGVASYEDIIKLREKTRQGIEGCIVGKAIYTGALELQKILTLAEEE